MQTSGNNQYHSAASYSHKMTFSTLLCFALAGLLTGFAIGGFAGHLSRGSFASASFAGHQRASSERAWTSAVSNANT